MGKVFVEIRNSQSCPFVVKERNTTKSFQSIESLILYYGSGTKLVFCCGGN